MTKFVIKDKFGKQYRLRFEKYATGMRILLYLGRERYLIGVIEINNESKTAEIEEFDLIKGFKDFSHRGLGSEVIRILGNYLRKTGINIMKGVIINSNITAAEFWKKQGFDVKPFSMKNSHIIYEIEKRFQFTSKS